MLEVGNGPSAKFGRPLVSLVLVRQRSSYGIVGRERVLAGSDCGFGTFARKEPTVAASVVWSKFRAMAEGARIASQRLWN